MRKRPSPNRLRLRLQRLWKHRPRARLSCRSLRPRQSRSRSKSAPQTSGRWKLALSNPDQRQSRLAPAMFAEKNRQARLGRRARIPATTAALPRAASTRRRAVKARPTLSVSRGPPVDRTAAARRIVGLVRRDRVLQIAAHARRATVARARQVKALPGIANGRLLARPFAIPPCRRDRVVHVQAVRRLGAVSPARQLRKSPRPREALRRAPMIVVHHQLLWMMKRARAAAAPGPRRPTPPRLYPARRASRSAAKAALRSRSQPATRVQMIGCGR